MNSLISVVVPCYLPPKLRFRKCIDSILVQSYSNIELIIVDDGNPESFSYLFNEYENKDNRISIVHTENNGVGAARNRGIMASKGEYIAFVDCDDFVESSFLSQLLSAIQGNDIAICSTCENSFIVNDSWNDKRTFFSQPALYADIQYLNFCTNKLFRANIIRDNSLFFDTSVKLGEDALFLSKYLSHCDSFKCISAQLYHYVPNIKSAVNSYIPEYWNWESQVISVQWNLFNQYPLSSHQEQALIAWLFKKYKGAFYYYFDHLIDVKTMKQIVHIICQHREFVQLRKTDYSTSYTYLNRSDKIILKMWLSFGERGVFIARTINIIARRLACRL